jgi:hypothetical protein
MGRGCQSLTLCWASQIENCSGQSRYKALEKNPLSGRREEPRGTAFTFSIRKNVPEIQGFWAVISISRNGPRMQLAEGEELGSNLLRVAQSSLGDPGGLGPLEKGPAHPTPPVSRRWLYRSTACRGWQPAKRQTLGARGNVRHRATLLSNALIERIREPGAGLFIRIRLPDDGR